MTLKRAVIDTFNYRGISNALFMVGIYSFFVTLFFFTYVSYVEKEVLKEQIERLVDDFGTDSQIVLKHMCPAELTVVQDIVTQMKAPDMSKEDKEVAESNNGLLQKAFLIAGVFLLLTMLVVLCLWVIARKTKNSFGQNRNELLKVLKKNAFLLLIVAVAEFLFITFISKNYWSADPNAVLLATVSEIKQRYPQKAAGICN